MQCVYMTGGAPGDPPAAAKPLTHFSNGKAVTVETLSGQATVDYFSPLEHWSGLQCHLPRAGLLLALGPARVA